MHCYIILFALLIQELFGTSALQTTLDLSLEYKNNPAHLLIYEDLRRLLPTLKSPSMIDALHEFLFESIVQDLTIIDSKETFLSGKSRDLVYFVLNQDEHLLYVIKVFRNPFQTTNKLLAELNSIQFLQKLNLPHVTGVTPLGIAQGCFENIEWVFLLETAAPGIRLDQYIYQIHYEQCSYAEALNAYYSFGQALAEFHGCNAGRLAPLSPKIFLDCADYLEEVLHSCVINDLKQKINLRSFELSVQQVMNRAKGILVPITYQHGDAHMGNIFFDVSDSKITFVDVAMMNQSFSSQLEPLGDGFADLYRADEYFRRKSDGFLSSEQIEKISNTILNGYMSVNAFPPPKEIEQFYRTYYKLKRLLHFSNYREQKDEKKRQRCKRSYENALDYFVELALASSSEIMDLKGAN